MAPIRCLLATAALSATLLGISAQAGANERGEALFDLCSTCHGPDAAGNHQYLAPSIAGLSEWYVLAQLGKFRDGRRGLHFDDLSGMRMRPMSLTLRTEEDVAAVAKYVAGLPPVKPEPQMEGGDPVRGQTLYALCSSCHGVQGEGLQPLNGPPLANTSDWYLVDQLKKFKAGVRGADPKDPIAIMMRPMALTLADDQAILDVVAYITTLSK
jgi:cytochrome c oxidase subunit 2